MEESQRRSQFLFLREYFQQNPALMLSVCYLLLTLCGIFYSKEFYSEFGINILQFAEISDLLIVGINEPMAILMFAGGLVIAWGMDRLIPINIRMQQKWRPKPKSLKRTLILWINYTPKNNDFNLLFGFLFIFITYGYLFVTLFAEWRADELKENDAATYLVKGEMNKQPQEFTLLGTTTNYVLLYNQSVKQSVVTPVENVLTLIPVIAKQSESQKADTKKQDPDAN